MAKLSLTDVAAGYMLTATYNANNDLIEAALENTLSLDGTSPNMMAAQLDMNSNRITNIPDAVNNQEPVSLAQMNGLVAAGGALESNDLSSVVTWANVPDAFITEASVTQHNAALTITESQISDLQSYLLLADLVAGNINAEASTDGWVLTSDGAGNAAWEAVSAAGRINTDINTATPGTTEAVTGAYEIYDLADDSQLANIGFAGDNTLQIRNMFDDSTNKIHLHLDNYTGSNTPYGIEIERGMINIRSATTSSISTGSGTWTYPINWMNRYDHIGFIVGPSNAVEQFLVRAVDENVPIVLQTQTTGTPGREGAYISIDPNGNNSPSGFPGIVMGHSVGSGGTEYDAFRTETSANGCASLNTNGAGAWKRILNENDLTGIGGFAQTITATWGRSGTSVETYASGSSSQYASGSVTKFDDNAELVFGTGLDVKIDFDTTNFVIAGVGDYSCTGFTNYSFPGTVIPGSLQIPTITTAELLDVTDAINTAASKVAGSHLFDTTANIPMYATGNADASTWVGEKAGSTITITPV